MSRLTKDERNELEELRREKAIMERKPYLDEICSITGMDLEHYNDLSMTSLKKAVEVARKAGMRRSGLNLEGNRGRGIPMYNGVPDVGFGFEFDEQTGKWKKVSLKSGEIVW